MMRMLTTPKPLIEPGRRIRRRTTPSRNFSRRNWKMRIQPWISPHTSAAPTHADVSKQMDTPRFQRFHQYEE